MKAINKAWRKAGKPQTDDAEGWAKLATDPTIIGESDLLEGARMNLARTPWFKSPYPAYAFQNLSANINRLKVARIPPHSARRDRFL